MLMEIMFPSVGHQLFLPVNILQAAGRLVKCDMLKEECSRGEKSSGRRVLPSQTVHKVPMY